MENTTHEENTNNEEMQKIKTLPESISAPPPSPFPEAIVGQKYLPGKSV